MPNTSRAITVSANRNVCVRVLETLSSTNATPTERSVIDSKRLTLITARQLLSALNQRQWPFRERSRAYIQGRNFEHPLEFCEMDRTFRRGLQIGPPGNRPDPSTLNHRLTPKS